MSCFLNASLCPSPPFSSPNPSSNLPSINYSPKLELDYMGLGCAVLMPPHSLIGAFKEEDGTSSHNGQIIETNSSPLCGSHLKLAPPSSCDDDDDDGEPLEHSASVGWPPISSYRKTTTRALSNPCRETTLADPPLNNNDIPAIVAMESNLRKPLRIKVSMDGTPFMRKLDLKSMQGYHHLAMELHKLFKFYKSKSQPFVNLISEIGRPLYFTDLHGAHYILTYKDGEGDWMLVGDTPWETFAKSARRIRIMRRLP